MMNLKNHFLIAMPALADTRFQRAVIYICEHSSDGAMGLVINHPLDGLTIDNLLEKIEIKNTGREISRHLDDPIYYGGPLSDNHGFILHSAEKKFISTIQVSETLMITTSKDILETFGTHQQPGQLLVTLGYSGWYAGQLEQEIAENSWLTVEADSQIIFDTPVHERWQSAAKKLGINIYNIASHSGRA